MGVPMVNQSIVARGYSDCNGLRRSPAFPHPPACTARRASASEIEPAATARAAASVSGVMPPDRAWASKAVGSALAAMRRRCDFDTARSSASGSRPSVPRHCGWDSPLQQPQFAEAGVAGSADDEVVVDGDTQRLGGGGDRLGHLDVGAAGGWVAARVVVDHQSVHITI